jgi:arginine-tRNA-protein transferase
MYYKFIPESNKEYASKLVKRAWRRFGNLYFRPICDGCDECKTLRIDVERFKFSKSQRRIIKKNKNTKIIIRKPQFTQESLNLYRKYHAFKAEKMERWSANVISDDEYFSSYVAGAKSFGKEVLFYIDDKLVCIDYIDILNDGISAIYCIYDPDYSDYSLGTYSLLYEIAYARVLKLKWIYLGYYVEGCESFAYKIKYKPYEILSNNYLGDEEIPVWEVFDV